MRCDSAKRHLLSLLKPITPHHITIQAREVKPKERDNYHLGVQSATPRSNQSEGASHLRRNTRPSLGTSRGHWTNMCHQSGLFHRSPRESLPLTHSLDAYCIPQAYTRWGRREPTGDIHSPSSLGTQSSEASVPLRTVYLSGEDKSTGFIPDDGRGNI